MNISREEVLQLQAFSLRKREIELEEEVFAMKLAARYNLKSGDTLDSVSGEIIRGPDEVIDGEST